MPPFSIPQGNQEKKHSLPMKTGLSILPRTPAGAAVNQTFASNRSCWQSSRFWPRRTAIEERRFDPLAPEGTTGSPLDLRHSHLMKQPTGRFRQFSRGILREETRIDRSVSLRTFNDQHPRRDTSQRRPVPQTDCLRRSNPSAKR